MNYVLPNPVNAFPVSGEMNYANSATLTGPMGPQWDVLRNLNLPSSYPSMPAVADQADAGAGQGGPYTGPFAGRQFLGEPFAVWLGMIGALLLLGWFANSPKTLGGANPAHIRVGGYNFLTVGIIAAIFLAMFKVLFNRWQIPGLTEFANAL